MLEQERLLELNMAGLPRFVKIRIYFFQEESITILVYVCLFSRGLFCYGFFIWSATIQEIPTIHSHFEHFVFFRAFCKAKNAHEGWGESYSDSYMYNKECLLRASTTIHSFYTYRFWIVTEVLFIFKNPIRNINNNQ